MTGEPKTMAVGARLAVKKLHRAGADVDAILDKVGLKAQDINKEDGWISERRMAELFEISAEELDDPYFGLHLGEEQRIQDYGAIAYIGLASETLGDAIANLQRYLHAVTEGWELKLKVEDDDAIINFYPKFPEFQHYRHMVEGTAGSILLAYQTFLGEPFLPKEVHFTHSFEGDTKEYQIVLGCPVKFQRNSNKVYLHRKDLALPIETADDTLLKVLKKYCKQTYNQRPAPSSKLASRIQETAISFIPKGKAQAKHIATEIGMSERTMHRRLQAEGLSFSKLLDDLKKGLALKYMQNEELGLIQVAFLLGYSDHSSFSTAFKRWTGTTPRQARAAQDCFVTKEFFA